MIHVDYDRLERGQVKEDQLARFETRIFLLQQTIAELA
jgi:hypothetical protein